MGENYALHGFIVAEEIIEFIRPLEDLKISELPASATFECEISKPYVSVQWYKGEEPIRRSHKHDVAVDGTIHRLTVNEVEGADEAEYTIVAKNNKCSATLAVQGRLLVSLEYQSYLYHSNHVNTGNMHLVYIEFLQYMSLYSAAPPVFNIDKFKETIILNEGKSTAIEIPFSANPQPKVTWDYNKSPLKSSKRFMVDVIYNMTSICIGRAEVGDSGSYSVTLENKFGKVTMTFKVVVLGMFSAKTDFAIHF